MMKPAIILTALLLAGCNQPAPQAPPSKIGRYQVVIGDGPYEPSLYVLDTVTGMMRMCKKAVGKNSRDLECGKPVSARP
ncbi:hypothetical protein [Sphingomonas crocodyli]|uniref:Uncharacterized protein n=1 Tax=Sphingomonas crocodyli TaxID=1979270 RepID=A0A437M9D9_9SPHN|nr:hypothetical protein [Sphingomonas crocodyli]RVT94302.1 hypothetical protein EOD43_10775 [Sphingomonas crocodyli]